MAVDLARQVAFALNYAHREGVVHRDLKPENILVADGQARVADFGVAKALSHGSGEQLTETGLAVGTPTYMSPEQASGGLVDGRTDIYALGCVLYEMLAGEPPFVGPTPQAITLKRLSEPVPSLRRVREVVPEALEQALTRALAKVPADRYATAGEFADALSTAERPGDTKPARHLPKRRLALLAGGFAIFGVLAIAVFSARTNEVDFSSTRVVVIPFENQTGDSTLGMVASMATDWVTRGLLETGLLDVVDQRSVPGISAQSSDLPARLATTTGAGTLVSGKVYRVHTDSLVFQTEVLDARTGRIVRSISPVKVRQREPLAGLEALRERLMSTLAALVDTTGSSWGITPSQPPTFEAYQAFLEGNAAYDRGDPRGAVEHLHRAARLDTTFNTALVIAAAAHSVLDQCGVVDSIGQVLQTRGDRVSATDRYRLARWVHGCHGDWRGAYRAVAELRRLSPRSERLVLLLANEAIPLNRPGETVRLLESLDPTSLGLGSEWRYHYHFARALHMLEDHERELAATKRGLEQYPHQQFLVATHLSALAALGREREVIARIEESLASPGQTFPSPGSMMVGAALEFEAHGHIRAARSMWERAVTWLETNPAAADAGPSRQSLLATALTGAERWEEAQSEWVRLMRVKSEAVSVDARAAVGLIAARQGDTLTAERMAAELARLSGPYLRGRHTLGRARIAASLGRREEAVRLVEAALAQGLPYSSSLHAEWGLAGLNSYPPFRDILRRRA
jgi:tetratricopeptide (TPR) repeat protein